MNDHTGILVTGVPRSGTTWVGNTLAKSSRLIYLHEPFASRHGAYFGAVNFPPHPFLNSKSENARSIESLLNLSLPWHFFFKSRFVSQLPRHLYGKFMGQKPLLKDPTVFFGAPWLYQRFKIFPIFIIRHPAAVFASMKRLGWNYQEDFESFLNQPDLLREYLGEFESQMKESLKERWSLLKQCALYWCMAQTILLKFQKIYPHWIFLKHEDIAQDPLASFERVFSRLGLPFTPNISRQILQECDPSHPAEAPTWNFHQQRISSRQSTIAWKIRLSREEQREIRRSTEDVSKYFYDGASWEV